MPKKAKSKAQQDSTLELFFSLCNAGKIGDAAPDEFRSRRRNVRQKFMLKEIQKAPYPTERVEDSHTITVYIKAYVTNQLPNKSSQSRAKESWSSLIKNESE